MTHRYAIPGLLALVTLFGLAAALLADGPWDAASCVALAIPLAAIAWRMLAQR